MQLDAPDYEPSALIRRKSETSVELVLRPYSLTQTSVVFPLEKKEEAMKLALAWIMQHEVPDRPEFRSVLGKKGRRVAVALCLALCAAALTGCEGDAAYIRNNKCALSGQAPAEKYRIWRHVFKTTGAKIYTCPNDVTVVIRNGEEQP